MTFSPFDWESEEERAAKEADPNWPDGPDEPDPSEYMDYDPDLEDPDDE
jgi:hypothetical protein